jgi:hypothetical protein
LARVLLSLGTMPTTTTTQKAQRDLARGKSPSTAAGEFVREEIDHIREGKHGAKNTKQAIAIGLSKARRAGIGAKPGPTASAQTKKKAAQDSRRAGKKPNPRRARASMEARKKEPHDTVSRAALSRQAKTSAARRRKAGGSTSPAAVARRAAKTRKRRAGRSPKRQAA